MGYSEQGGAAGEERDCGKRRLRTQVSQGSTLQTTLHGCSEIHLRGCHTQEFLAQSPQQENLRDSLGVTPTPGWQLSLMVTLSVSSTGAQHQGV